MGGTSSRVLAIRQFGSGIQRQGRRWEPHPKAIPTFSCSGDGTGRVWNAKTCEAAAVQFTENTSEWNAITYSPGGTRPASASREGRFCVWDSETDRAVTDLFSVEIGNVLSITRDQWYVLTFRRRYKHADLLVRIQEGVIATTFCSVIPLTSERYRISEFYAEMLHCSNMTIMNCGAEFDSMDDTDGRLQSGLLGLEELAKAIAMVKTRTGIPWTKITIRLHRPWNSNASRYSPSLMEWDDKEGDGMG